MNMNRSKKYYYQKPNYKKDDIIDEQSLLYSTIQKEHNNIMSPNNNPSWNASKKISISSILTPTSEKEGKKYIHKNIKKYIYFDKKKKLSSRLNFREKKSSMEKYFIKR